MRDTFDGHTVKRNARKKRSTKRRNAFKARRTTQLKRYNRDAWNSFRGQIFRAVDEVIKHKRQRKRRAVSRFTSVDRPCGEGDKRSPAVITAPFILDTRASKNNSSLHENVDGELPLLATKGFNTD